MSTTCFTPPAFQSRVVPVIVLTEAAHAVPLAHALLDGGIDVMEITLRSSAALASIEAVAKAVPQMHVGAGTVTRVAEVQQVIDAGATFALSPGCTDALVMTPGEVMLRREQGFSLMKLFPAQQAGGMGMLKALGGPLPDVRFCPTGGVSVDNLGEFLKLPNVAMAGGSWLTPVDAMVSGDWSRITALAASAVAVARSV